MGKKKTKLPPAALVLDAICKVILQDITDPTPYEDSEIILAPSIEKQNYDLIIGMAYGRWIREVACEGVKACVAAGDLDRAKRILDVREYICGLFAPDDFDSYMLYTEWGREPEKQFWLPRRHVLYPIAEGFQDLAENRIDILIVSTPPRVGKTTTGVFAQTWQMGRVPTSANVMSGHSDMLTKGFHKEALDIIGDVTTYRFNVCFPFAPLVAKSMSDETITLYSKKARFPTLTCRAAEATLTGAVEIGTRGWLYCDDMVADREQALSTQRMDKLYAAYLNQLKDRKLDGAKEVHIGTRWVPNDVTGRIIDENEGNPRCKVIAIPALNEQGESNFNYLFGLGFSTEYYEEMRKSLEEAGEGDSWSAKYMCEPYYIGGLTFPEDELNYYDDLPNGEPDAIIAVCDTKDRGKDYCVQPIGYVYGNKHYIEDVICDNSLPEVVEPRLASSLVLHNVALARYESNSAGGRIADGIAEQCKKLGHTVTIQKQYSTQNKETRIIVDAGWIKQNCYFKKDPPNADYKKFINMLTHYTTEGKNLHDDAPDAMSMYKRFADTIVSPEVEVIDRLW